MNEENKTVPQAEIEAIEKDSAKIGKAAPAPIGVIYGAQINYHEGQRSGFGALLQPSSHSKHAHLHMFSFKVMGTKCEITSCEYDYIHVSEIEDYLNSDKRGLEAEPLQAVKECIEEYLQGLTIGITQFI